MHLESYEVAAEQQREANKLAREPLAPYWERLETIGKADDFWEAVEESILSIEDDGRIILAFGGPNVWLTPDLMMNGSWAGPVIRCEAPTMDLEDVARSLYEAIEEVNG
jgi:hypothetical protein